MAQGSRLRQIADNDAELLFGGEQAPPPPEPPRAPQPQNPAAQNAQAVATSMLLVALKSLSQRAIIAISHLFVLATAISAWWLWRTTLPQPSVNQLVGLTLYGVLILALNFLVLRKR
jgi:hypothetical protein